MYKSIFKISLLCILFYGCSKEKQKPVLQENDKIKLSILSGNNQTAATGEPLNDSIVVKVLNNGSPLANCIVHFTGSGCNSDIITELQTHADGTVRYSWHLAANQGPQTLNIVALNGPVKVDSTIIQATATVKPGQETGACTPPNMTPLCLANLSNGRLLACFDGNTSLRYSDDNGISWNPVKGLGSTHHIVQIAISQQDGIFLGTVADGIFYSKDFGENWSDITPPLFNKADPINDMGYSSDALMFTSQPGNVYTSINKGKTWIKSISGLSPDYGHLFPCKLNNGDMYVLNTDLVLFKSVDGGKTWVAQKTIDNEQVWAICVNNKGWLYKAILTNSTQGAFSTVYISKDDGYSFSKLSTFNDFVWSMNELQDGYLYFNDLYNYKKIYSKDYIWLVAKNIAGPIISNKIFLINQNKFIYIDYQFIKRIDSF